jgi:hypothetical protein
MMLTDESFPHRYSYAPLDAGPGDSGPTYSYPGARTDGGHDGLLVRCHAPGHDPWIGLFASGGWGARGLYPHPDEQTLCVVADGAGYMVRVDDPTQWMEIEADPVVDVRPLPSQGLLLVSNHSRVVAYGRTGVAWTTWLPVDGIEFSDITADQIRGWATDPMYDDRIHFSIDLGTGEHTLDYPT